MHFYRMMLIGAAALALAIPSARAADLPRPIYKATPVAVAPSWAGPYLGVHLGYSNSYEKTRITGGNPLSSTVLAMGLLPSQHDTQTDGWAFGGHLGWNWVSSVWLLGVEADLQWSDAKGSHSSTFSLAPLGAPVSITGAATAEREWYGTVRARGGVFLSDRFLAYITGGFAYGSFNHSASATLSAPAPFGAAAAVNYGTNETGFVVGGGFEWALSQNWRLAAEYLYSDYGSISGSYGTTVAGAPVAFTATHDLVYHDVRGKLTYAFDWPTR